MRKSVCRIDEIPDCFTYRTESCSRGRNLSRYDISCIAGKVTRCTRESSSTTSSKTCATRTSNRRSITRPGIVSGRTNGGGSKSSDYLTRWTKISGSSSYSSSLGSYGRPWDTGRSCRRKARTTESSDSRSITRPSIVRRSTDYERSKSSNYLTRWTKISSSSSYSCWLRPSESSGNTSRSYIRRTSGTTSRTCLSILGSEVTLFSSCYTVIEGLIIECSISTVGYIIAPTFIAMYSLRSPCTSCLIWERKIRNTRIHGPIDKFWGICIEAGSDTKTSCFFIVNLVHNLSDRRSWYRWGLFSENTTIIIGCNNISAIISLCYVCWTRPIITRCPKVIGSTLKNRDLRCIGNNGEIWRIKYISRIVSKARKIVRYIEASRSICSYTTRFQGANTHRSEITSKYMSTR